MPKNKKMAVNLGIQTCIPSLSSILLAVWEKSEDTL